jgi:hypothetical protein
MSDTLYHYTSMSTLSAILEKIKENTLTLRATEIRYLNDLAENEIAVEILVEELIRYEESLGKDKSKNMAKDLTKNKLDFFKRIPCGSWYPFIFSLSAEPDDLPMWNTYADNALGVSIGFNKEKLEKITENNKPTLKQCDYQQTEIKKYIKTHISNIYNSITINSYGTQISDNFDDTLWGKFKESVPILKHHTFEYENEWRLIFDKKIDSNNPNTYFKSLNFNVNNGLPKPYIEFTLETSIIEEIVVGPCANFELVKQSLILMLGKAGFIPSNNKDALKVKITQSRCPYRTI